MKERDGHIHNYQMPHSSFGFKRSRQNQGNEAIYVRNLGFFVVSLSPTIKRLSHYHETGHDVFLPHPFQLTAILKHPNMKYTLHSLKSVITKFKSQSKWPHNIISFKKFTRRKIMYSKMIYTQPSLSAVSLGDFSL
jgi:hypothetical protein